VLLENCESKFPLDAMGIIAQLSRDFCLKLLRFVRGERREPPPDPHMFVIATLVGFHSPNAPLFGPLPIRAFSRHTAALRIASGTTGWRLHDLRRTARSLMSRAGVAPDIAERLI
jgi:hypothetical protein